jgi:F-type H+-transporting ATPase subunit epsilon
MKTFLLEIISPKKKLYDMDVISVSVPSATGILTILHNHVPLFALLTEGIIKVISNKGEDYFSIGGGYIETTGKKVRVLVSKAFHQDEIDEQAVHNALKEAERELKEAPTSADRKTAMAAYKRSLIDSKLLKRRKKVSS